LELACERYAKFVSIVGTGEKIEQAARACVQSDKVPEKTVKEVITEMQRCLSMQPEWKA
jgi:hypothetical protein